MGLFSVFPIPGLLDASVKAGAPGSLGYQGGCQVPHQVKTLSAARMYSEPSGLEGHSTRSWELSDPTMNILHWLPLLPRSCWQGVGAPRHWEGHRL